MIALMIAIGVAGAAEPKSPAYCDHPKEEVCKSVTKKAGAVSVGEIRKRISASLDKELGQSGILEKISMDISGGNGASSQDLAAAGKKREEAIKLYSLVLNRAQDLIFDEFKKIGISEADLNRRLTEIRKNVADRVEKLPNFQNKILGVGSTEIANRVQTTDIISVRRFKMPGREGESLDFYRSCGIDGLVVQAFYSESDRGFQICPGFLLDLLASNTLDSLTFVSAHELGHAIGVQVELSKSAEHLTPSAPMAEHYRAYLGCVQKNYAKDFTSIEVKENYILDTGLPSLKAKVVALEAANPVDVNEVVVAKRWVEMAEEKVDAMDSIQEEVNHTFPPKASTVEQHSLELCADAVGYSGMEDLYRDHPSADPWQTFANQFGSFCAVVSDPYRKLLYGPVMEDGMHPTVDYRISAAMRDPVIRKALGCRPLDGPNDPPFCGLNGAEVPEKSTVGPYSPPTARSSSSDAD
jgi:hypothetical protein